jgi:hypothetical protein
VGPTPNLEPAFSSIQREIFESADRAGRATCVQCHSNAGHFFAAGLSLESDVAYTTIVGAPSRLKLGAVLVVPGDPDGSCLVHKIEGAPGIVGLRMPRNGPPYLTSGQILVIRRWIELGARND